MRKEIVPVDMQSEQKELLGILSKRQLLYLIGGGAVLYWYIPFIYPLFSNWITGIIVSIVSSVPIIAIVLFLAFYKFEKYHMYTDKYLITKLQYKSQLGNWRKGPEKNYKVEDF